MQRVFGLILWWAASKASGREMRVKKLTFPLQPLWRFLHSGERVMKIFYLLYCSGSVGQKKKKSALSLSTIPQRNCNADNRWRAGFLLQYVVSEENHSAECKCRRSSFRRSLVCIYTQPCISYASKTPLHANASLAQIKPKCQMLVLPPSPIPPSHPGCKAQNTVEMLLLYWKEGPWRRESAREDFTARAWQAAETHDISLLWGAQARGVDIWGATAALPTSVGESECCSLTLHTCPAWRFCCGTPVTLTLAIAGNNLRGGTKTKISTLRDTHRIILNSRSKLWPSRIGWY